MFACGEHGRLAEALVRDRDGPHAGKQCRPEIVDISLRQGERLDVFVEMGMLHAVVKVGPRHRHVAQVRRPRRRLADAAKAPEESEEAHASDELSNALTQ